MKFWGVLWLQPWSLPASISPPHLNSASMDCCGVFLSSERQVQEEKRLRLVEACREHDEEGGRLTGRFMDLIHHLFQIILKLSPEGFKKRFFLIKTIHEWEIFDVHADVRLWSSGFESVMENRRGQTQHWWVSFATTLIQTSQHLQHAASHPASLHALTK